MKETHWMDELDEHSRVILINLAARMKIEQPNMHPTMSSFLYDVHNKYGEVRNTISKLIQFA